ncbi:GntR family transcriptional regulator [uncultured Tessaracoccus sp.]|uniref:GntR family transcriptional regulator n=1 Tax=uncultured Tessaracoccus sp. TaxID=905023 RepID=UPI0026009AEC|nr:GntR family transcriptional regulator [uncultured Tessaracoccus sp.]
MQILISNTAGVPIYEQIRVGIREAILSGELAEGEAVPSIRQLAKDLRVSVITTTRAYNELVADGFLANVPGKGFYVLPTDRELVREQVLRAVEELLDEAAAKARPAGITVDELHHILDTITEDDA